MAIDFQRRTNDAAVSHPQHIGHGGMFHPGIGQHRRRGQHLFHRLQIRHRRRLTGDLARHQHRIGDRGKHRRAGTIRQGAAVQAVGKFGADVVEHRQITAAKAGAIAQRSPGVGAPGPHVAGIGTGEDFADKLRPGGGGQCDRALRVPQHIDAERHGDVRAQLPDHKGHGGGRGCIDLEFIGPVVFIAEHHRVEPGRLEGDKIGTGGIDQPLEARRGIMERGAR